MDFKIQGGRELKGQIELKTSKNSAVALLCASLLNHGTTVLRFLPKIEEVFRIIEVLQSIGVSCVWTGNDSLTVQRPDVLQLHQIDQNAARRTRAVLLLIGPLVHEYSSFELPRAGGCRLGSRTVAPYIHALEAFGIRMSMDKYDQYTFEGTIKSPQRLVLYESGDTVSEMALMVAAGLDMETTIQFASANYMVQDLCFFLTQLGVEIDGIGTSILRVRGRSQISREAVYCPAEDPIEAMFFVTAAIVTNSQITIRRTPIDFMSLELLKLKIMGLEFEQSQRYKARNNKTDLVDITVHKHNEGLLAPPDKIHANVYPGLNQDNLPYFVVIAAFACGRTLVHDWTYEARVPYYTQLSKLGVMIKQVDQHRVHISGPSKVKRANITCPPALRPASLFLLLMLATTGESYLRDVYVINRGYENLVGRLTELGASITSTEAAVSVPGLDWGNNLLKASPLRRFYGYCRWLQSKVWLFTCFVAALFGLFVWTQD